MCENAEGDAANLDDASEAPRRAPPEIIVEGRYGSATVYKNSAGVKIPVPAFEHYLYRGEDLYVVNFLEFSMCTELAHLADGAPPAARSPEVAPLEEEADGARAPPSPRRRGRHANATYPFSPEHRLSDSHEVRLRSKLRPFILGGEQAAQASSSISCRKPGRESQPARL